MSLQPNYEKLALIKKEFEGFKQNAYLDSGNVATVGLGSTYNFDKKRKVQIGDFVTWQTAVRWAELENQQKINEINQYIKVPLNENQSTAIIDYVYNRGIGNFLKTQLDELINANPNDLAIGKEILGTGLRDRIGNLLWGLGRRRRAEKHLYYTGELKFNWPKWG